MSNETFIILLVSGFVFFLFKREIALWLIEAMYICHASRASDCPCTCNKVKESCASNGTCTSDGRFDAAKNFCKSMWNSRPSARGNCVNDGNFKNLKDNQQPNMESCNTVYNESNYVVKAAIDHRFCGSSYDLVSASNDSSHFPRVYNSPMQDINPDDLA